MKTGARKALVHHGGPTRRWGNADVSARLAAAWDASQSEDDILTHGFHAYPARMHPGLARALIAEFGQAGGRLLDPFCGSGTTLVEAMVAGMEGVGSDLNPVALMVAEIKCARRTSAERERLRATLEAVMEASLLRVRKRVPSRAPLGATQRSFYDAHVLLELAGLWTEIEAVSDLDDRLALKVLLSAIVVKFSKQRADTSSETTEKRIGKGVPSRFWRRKGEELLERWAALEEACRHHPDVPRPRILEADARNLKPALGASWTADLVLTSPPYGGTYDYAQHHARRYPWLGVTAERFERLEIGARRHLSGGSSRGSKVHRERAGGSSPDAARDRWDREVVAALESMAQHLAPSGTALWVMGDGQIGRQRVPADVQLRELAPRAGLYVAAMATQIRPDWHGGEARGEHLIALRHASQEHQRRPHGPR